MKNTVLFIAFLFSIGTMAAQENEIIAEGTVLTLGTATASGYDYLDFPESNFIIKRGAIANFSNLEGRKVVVSEVVTENGATEVILKRKDGQNFFRFWPKVSANLEEALANGELKIARNSVELIVTP